MGNVNWGQTNRSYTLNSALISSNMGRNDWIGFMGGRSTVQLQRLVIMIVYITLSIFVCSIHANAEASKYRFDLVAGKKNEVCRHMYKVYNRHFSQLLNIEAAKKELYDLFVSTYRKPEILHSFYPTSPEFEAIKWDIRKYIDPNHKPKNEGIALISHIDIDNDGIDDTLVKIVFYSIGSHYSERLIIASNFKPKQTGPIRYDDFYRNQPISLGYAAILRPFLFKGITYLHWYEFEQPKGDATPDPTVYNKWIIIRKYLGTIFDKTGNYETKYEDICKFNVIDIEVERSIQEMQKKMHKKGE